MSDNHVTTPRDIVIIGGGTAGWLTAGLIAAQARKKPSSPLRVCVIESPRIPAVGVGEGTWPTMRSTLHAIGVNEKDFLSACDVAFKQGSKFNHWVTGAGDDYYYHPFETPVGFQDLNPVDYWRQSRTSLSFSDFVSAQEEVCQKHLGPKRPNSPNYSGFTNYGYHLNSAKFSNFLKAHCQSKLAVEFISDDVVEVIEKSDGDIEAVKTEQGKTVSGRLFIDCTGFSSVLIGQHYNVPFIDKSDILFVDTALAAHVPYDDGVDILSQTNSTAQSAGWIWDIGLPSRRGVGYVYSRQYVDDQTAALTLNDYIEKTSGRAKNIEFRKIPIKSGYREIAWRKNCVAIGLSNGFLEPLEASAMVMVETAANFIANHLPTLQDDIPALRDRFNVTNQNHWGKIIDFLKLHYVLSQRTEPFWVDNRDPKTIPDTLLKNLEAWKIKSPWRDTINDPTELFPAASYQYVLYGMGFSLPSALTPLSEDDISLAKEHYRKVERDKKRLPELLQTNLDYLRSSL